MTEYNGVGLPAGNKAFGSARHRCSTSFRSRLSFDPVRETHYHCLVFTKILPASFASCGPRGDVSQTGHGPRAARSHMFARSNAQGLKYEVQAGIV